MRSRLRLLICFACVLALCSTLRADDVVPAVAEIRPTPSYADLLTRIEKLEENNKPRLPTVNWTGQLQADAIGFAASDDHRARFGETPNGLAFRRARLGMLGDYGSIDYRIEADFALPGRPSFLDVYVAVKDIPHLGMVRIGHFFEPFSLERVTANRFTTFLERSLIDEAFAPARNLGGMIRRTLAEDRVTIAAGIFAADSDAFGDAFGRPLGLAGTGRITALPIFEGDGERLLHVGLGYSLRGANDGQVRFRARPELRIGAASGNIPFVVDTKSLAADYYQLFGLEMLAVNGPFALQAECTMVQVALKSGLHSFFFGAYGEATWIVTGEHRIYRKDNGTVDRLIPSRDFIGAETGSFGGGPGAIEFALRLSYLDLTDGTIRGGRVMDATLGVNWYLNRYLRLTANYIHSMPESMIGKAGTSDAVGVRVGWDF